MDHIGWTPSMFAHQVFFDEMFWREHTFCDPGNRGGGSQTGYLPSFTVLPLQKLSFPHRY